jgi:hypothetical protein
MMQKSTTFTTILHIKKCHFHYDMQNFFIKVVFSNTSAYVITAFTVAVISSGFSAGNIHRLP